MGVHRFDIPLVVALVTAGPALATTPPWARTESREACAASTPLRQPFFGDLHVHTGFSADAYIDGARVGPRDAYDFAHGATIPVSDDQEQQTRTSTIDRPLDFMAVTDHAELFGEVDRCVTPGSPSYDFTVCQLLRSFEATGSELFETTVAWLTPLGTYHLSPNPATGLDFCSTPGVDCDAAAVSMWQEVQAAAEEAYDRTSACTFTSFIGYEYTASPLGAHRHRNIVFRNAHVPPIALSLLDTLAGGVPQGLWSAIENQCLHAGTGCDAVIIPHNPNLSAGLQLDDPIDAADAFRRQTIEPLIELHQLKGNSECRFDRIAGIGVGTTDELCTFEQLRVQQQGPFAEDLPIPQYPRRNVIREALKDGLAFEDTLGVNPFRMGFVGSTDNHNALGGSVAERDWPGGGGQGDATPERQIGDGMRNNPGGLAVAWAEENSRDAIFSAFRRRETYATSGTRPVLRFFAGALDDVACGAADFVERAYATGTPMGGEIGAVRGRKSPRFAVWAQKDPGTPGLPGTDLQRIQIVKGWVDRDGTEHEQVFDVAGDAGNGADVDPATCEPRGSGAAELCAMWEDPAFDPGERAFYYARVLENPSCRWSTRLCQEAGVDPFATDCAAQAAAVSPAFADCCLVTANDPFLSPTIQERAWSSPVWYRPESIGRLRARLRFGADAGSDDTFTLRARLGAFPAVLDPGAGLTFRLSDDDDVLVIDVPAGGFRRHGRRWVFKDPAQGRKLVLSATRGGAKLSVTAGGDLSAAAREDHAMTITVEGSLFRSVHGRRWLMRDDTLAPAG